MNQRTRMRCWYTALILNTLIFLYLLFCTLTGTKPL